MSPRARHLLYGSITIGMALLGIMAAGYLAFHGSAS